MNITAYEVPVEKLRRHCDPANEDKKGKEG